MAKAVRILPPGSLNSGVPVTVQLESLDVWLELGYTKVEGEDYTETPVMDTQGKLFTSYVAYGDAGQNPAVAGTVKDEPMPFAPVSVDGQETQPAEQPAAEAQPAAVEPAPVPATNDFSLNTPVSTGDQPVEVSK